MVLGFISVKTDTLMLFCLKLCMPSAQWSAIITLSPSKPHTYCKDQDERKVWQKKKNSYIGETV